MLAVTRVINACVLIEIGNHGVLTDPYFDEHRFFKFNEPIGLTARELPKLTALIGGHRVFDHWQPRSLRTYHHHGTTPVYTASVGMRRAARRAGLPQAEVLDWDEHRTHQELTISAVAGGRTFGMRTNSYVLSTPDISVFVATEASNLDSIRACATRHRVDVAVLPIEAVDSRLPTRDGRGDRA